ncbi:MAG: efflux RND transporter periplasmic adaptor subunit [Pseudomonadota bacterium]
MEIYNKIRKIISEHSRQNFIIFSTIIALLGIILCVTLFTTKKIEPITKVVEVVAATPQHIEQTVRLIGTVRAKRSTLLIAKASGILEVLRKAGDTVTKDTLIARISNPDIEKRCESAVSSVQIANAQFERTKILLKTGASSKQAAEEKQSLFLEAERNLAAANIELAKIRFHAPFDGIIGAYKGRDGTEIKEGAILLTFYDPTTMIVEFDIPASLIASVNIGQKVVIDGKQYPLQEVQKMLDESTHMAPATVAIESKECIVGMPIDVELTVSEKNNVIVLPDDAVFLEQGKPHVYLIKDSKTVLKPIELGLRARDMVEITKGLVAGDVIVSHGQSRLSNDTEVKIHNPKVAEAVKNTDTSLKK